MPPGGSNPVTRVLKSGEPELMTHMSEHVLREGREERALELLRELGVASYLSVPIQVGGKAQGVLSLVSADPQRRYADADLAVAQEYGRRAGMAIEKMLLFEAERESRKRAQEAVHLRDEFLSIASHELRTPLTPLRMQLQSLSRSLSKGRDALAPDRVRAMVQVSDRMVTRLSGLVDDLLDVSRINAGRLALRYESFDLVEMARELVERFRGELDKVRCPATVTATGNLHDGKLEGRWDRSRMEQVLANLLTNAMRYGAGMPIRVQLEGGGEDAVLAVADQGIGVAPEDQKRIFHRFERAAPSSHYGGLGLGLYITSQIVDMHGGRIHVESELGRGARFVVRVPREPSAEQEARSQAGLSVAQKLAPHAGGDPLRSDANHS
jgi:signal transduction histidine kinase